MLESIPRLEREDCLGTLGVKVMITTPSVLQTPNYILRVLILKESGLPLSVKALVALGPKLSCRDHVVVHQSGTDSQSKDAYV